MKSLVKYFFLALVAGITLYTILNSLTLLIWGDPSVHGVPRLFHPPEILILHYTSMVSPALAHLVVPLFLIISGLGFFVYFGIRQVTAKNSILHPHRDTIVHYIRKHPGKHFSTLMRETGINRGTLYYHLWQLKTHSVVLEVKDGGLTRYFIHLDVFEPLKQKLMFHMDNPIRDQIISMLKADSVVSRQDFIKNLGISGPSLWYHIQLLGRDGIVHVEQEGRRTLYVLSYNAAQILKSNIQKIQPATKSRDPTTRYPEVTLESVHDTKVQV
ncbi:MAG: hypothetical protein Q7T80_08765 [Methanoregula sp.]|nr:hypothetical protein [Methanoregula sp.]